jgi:ATP-dependent Clp protease ATP-binding subunit ClpA
MNTEKEFGARPIKRIIQNLCEDFISDEILRGNIFENHPIKLTFKETLQIKSKII